MISDIADLGAEYVILTLIGLSYFSNELGGGTGVQSTQRIFYVFLCVFVGLVYDCKQNFWKFVFVWLIYYSK